MRAGGLCIVLTLLSSGSAARADDADDLVAKGERLAQQGEFTQAIVAFKEADARWPRAAHACMIGLAYMRRELWPQAELFLAQCERRATATDKPPGWIDGAWQQLAAKLSAAQIPSVAITVNPPDAAARLTVSSFEPDEGFAPQAIHLAPGQHILEVTAPGFRGVRRAITVVRGEPQAVSFNLEKDPSFVPRPNEVPRVGEPPLVTWQSVRPKIPWIVIGAGAALAASALLYDQFALQPVRDRLDAAESRATYDASADEFRSKRAVTIGLVIGAAVTIGAGVALRYTLFAPDDDTPQVSAQAGDGEQMIVVRWRR
jgi:hypothetical protein